MKITRPGHRSTSERWKPEYQRRAARQAAAEREACRAISLQCGHWATREQVVIYQVFARREGAKRGQVFCEVCGRWRGRTRTPKLSTVEGQLPLF